MSLSLLKNRILFVAIFIIFIVPVSTLAITGSIREDKYPRLANYFLNWTISENEAKELSRWDLLVLDMEVGMNSRRNLELIREYNSDIIILAYISSMETRYDMAGNGHAKLRNKLINNINEDWWLRDVNNNKLIFWNNNWMLNITDQTGWNNFLPQFVKNEILATGLWDGVYYDNAWHEIAWYKNGNIDLNRDGIKESNEVLNREWQNGTTKIIKKTRELVGDNYIIMGNGSSFDGFQPYLNGIMLESFPTPWENDGTWTSSMRAYFRTQEKNKNPKTTIINANNYSKNNYQKMRFGLSSVLLGDGFSSFDYGEVQHAQTWWYDEYSFNLGIPIDDAVRVDGQENNFTPGIWKREYAKGVVYVNSGKTAKDVALEEQSRIINSGKVVGNIFLQPSDGIILENLETKSISNSKNCREYKAYDFRGKLINSSYLLCDKSNKYLYVTYRGDKRIVKNAVNKVNLVDANKDALFERVDSLEFGQESNVRIFSNSSNKLLGIFSAYPKIFRCGVKTKTGDLDGDGYPEIITVPAWGGAHIKIFGFNGALKTEFFADSKSFRGSYDIRLKDIDNNGSNEILVLSF